MGVPQTAKWQEMAEEAVMGGLASDEDVIGVVIDIDTANVAKSGVGAGLTPIEMYPESYSLQDRNSYRSKLAVGFLPPFLTADNSTEARRSCAAI